MAGGSQVQERDRESDRIIRTQTIPQAWFKLRKHPIQQQLWKCPARFIAVPAGRGSGKTELARRKLVLALRERKKWPTPRYFYAMPTRDQAKRTAWQHFLNLIPKNWLARRPMVSELKIETIFGSELYIVGLDKPERIEGEQWDGCVLDESCNMPPKAFDMSVLPALTWRDGWCWRIGVPKRTGPASTEFRKFFEEAQRGDKPDAAGFTWPSSDIAPEEKLRWAQEHMDAKDYAEQYDAQFQTAGGAVFHAFDRAENIKPVEYHTNQPIVVGSDFNVDPMAWVVGHRYENRLEWFDELWLRDCNTQMALDVLWQRYQDHKGGWEFYGDATGAARKTSASESDYLHILNDARFQQAGRDVYYPKANPPVADRFASCNAMFRNARGQRRMYVAPTCERLIEDLEARTPTTKPGSMVGHITDAMGYPVHMLFPVSLDAGAESYEITVAAV